MIEEFMAKLDQSLRGPLRAKRRLLEEARAGLNDAVEAHLAAGIDRPFATRRALADFGTVPQLRAHFQAELDMVQTRQMARLSVLLVPLLTLFWNVVWELNPFPTWQVPSVPFLMAATASGVALATSLPALAALVITGRYGRGKSWTGMQRGMRLLACTGTGAFAVAALTLPTVDPKTLLWLPTTATVIATAALGLVAATLCQPLQRAGSTAGPISKSSLFSSQRADRARRRAGSS